MAAESKGKAGFRRLCARRRFSKTGWAIAHAAESHGAARHVADDERERTAGIGKPGKALAGTAVIRVGLYALRLERRIIAPPFAAFIGGHPSAHAIPTGTDYQQTRFARGEIGPACRSKQAEVCPVPAEPPRRHSGERERHFMEPAVLALRRPAPKEASSTGGNMGDGYLPCPDDRCPSPREPELARGRQRCRCR